MKLLSLVVAASFAAMLASSPLANATEKPDYDVILDDGAVQVRSYPSLLIAEVTVSGDRDQAASRAFRQLAGFIFGGNDSETSIAMTAPVVQTPQEDGDWVVNFMMPSKFTKDTLPRPNDPDIRVSLSPPAQTISLRFNGRSTETNLSQHREELKRYMAEKNLKAIGPHFYAFYNAPMVPGVFRRNEVHYPVKAVETVTVEPPAP